jgi:hypothetical protein
MSFVVVLFGRPAHCKGIAAMRRSVARGVFVLVAVLSGMAAAACPAAAPAEFMVELSLGGQRIEGMPLAFDARQVVLLARDGRLWRFAPGEARDYRQSAADFRPYTVSEMRAALLGELGAGFDVSGTSHYLVAHARGERDRWAPRFEELYRSFVHYFSVRGLAPRPPRVPLVAIVCRDRAEFARHAARTFGETDGPDGLAGYYSAETNRIVLYDMGDSEDWRRNASVIIHEATHQTAFNTGVHSRVAPPPVWVAEGLATMFEAPGVHDARRHAQPADRINRERLAAFRRLLRPQYRGERIAALVASDEMFRSAPQAAYAEAWALSFFLAETQPRPYVQYLARTAGKPPLADVGPEERTADFTALFGDDWAMLAARLLRFIDGLGP